MQETEAERKAAEQIKKDEEEKREAERRKEEDRVRAEEEKKTKAVELSTPKDSDRSEQHFETLGGLPDPTIDQIEDRISNRLENEGDADYWRHSALFACGEP